MSNKLSLLADSWRNKATRGEAFFEPTERIRTYRQCADELETALAASGSDDAHPIFAESVEHILGALTSLAVDGKVSIDSARAAVKTTAIYRSDTEPTREIPDRDDLAQAIFIADSRSGLNVVTKSARHYQIADAVLALFRAPRLQTCDCFEYPAATDHVKDCPYWSPLPSEAKP